MLPLRDDVPSRRKPVTVWALIIVNVVLFLYEVQMPPRVQQAFLFQFGMVPAQLSTIDGFMQHWYTIISAMFLHSGWLHILGNMWFLWVFGDNVEDRLGPIGFLVFYFLGGLASALLLVASDPTFQYPAIGASGAIAAVLGAYVVFYPGARVLSIVPICFIPLILQVPALLWIGFWFIEQALNGLEALQMVSSHGGVGWWAHIGGFLFGVAAALPLRGRYRPPEIEE